MVVVSTAGHDRHRVYLVLSCDEKIASLADGNKRSIVAPKKKRVTHMKAIAMIDDSNAFLDRLKNTKCSREQDIQIRKKLREIKPQNDES
jgi:ribosomal protein L14E/L6E/L27E